MSATCGAAPLATTARNFGVRGYPESLLFSPGGAAVSSPGRQPWVGSEEKRFSSPGGAALTNSRLHRDIGYGRPYLPDICPAG